MAVGCEIFVGIANKAVWAVEEAGFAVTVKAVARLKLSGLEICSD